MPSDPRTRAFLIHLAGYLVVNAILIVLNLMQTPAEGETRTYWFQWPLIGWGIGVAAHGLALLLERKAPPKSALADERVRGFVVHLFVYVAVNILLIVVDLSTTPGAQWFWWPLLGWGAGLAAHGFAVWRAMRGGAGEPTTLETDSPWPESSVTEGPKTGEVTTPIEPAGAAPKPATAATEAPRTEAPKPAPPTSAAPKADESKPAEPATEQPKAARAKRAPRKPRAPRKAPPKQS